MPDCPGALHFAQMRDGAMIRLRFPGGELTTNQLRDLSVLSSLHGNGLVDLTNRANLQIRGLDNITPDALEQLLRDGNILAGAPWSDRLRNIMADPLQDRSGDGLTDTRQLVARLDKQLQDSTGLKNLSPKFSFIIDNGSPYRLARQPHDLALVAQTYEDGVIFRLSIANHDTELCVLPQQGPDLLIRVATHICQNRQTARNCKRAGRSQEWLDNYGLETVTAQIKSLFPAAMTIKPGTTRPGTARQPPIGIIPQSRSGLFTLGLGVPVSRLTAGQLSLLADWSDNHGSGIVRLSPWQLLYIPDIPLSHTRQLEKLAREREFTTSRTFLDCQVFACSGGTGCTRTRMPCKEDGLALVHQIMASPDNTASPRPAALKIHLSGCDRGCALTGKADILALARTDGSGYMLHNNKGLAELRGSADTSWALSRDNSVNRIFQKIQDRTIDV